MPGWIAGPAWACGGFFCDSVEPVSQAQERILFREDEAGWTAFVEVSFAGPPIDFGWVLPLPVAIDPATDVQTAAPGLFDDLEGATAVQLVTSDTAVLADMGYVSSGCDAGCGDGVLGSTSPSTAGVEVLGEAVVGPYALEVLTADDGANLVNWLQQAGYQFPYSAWPLVDRYVERGWAFLGIRLAPDVPAGPIDTLVVRCGQERPEIPLVITSIAAVPDMEITAYVLADERYVPDGDWPETPVSFDEVLGLDDYDRVLREALDVRGGRGWRTEFAGPDEHWTGSVAPDTLVALGRGGYLTRIRTFASPHEMTSDPFFVADPSAPDVSNRVVLGARAAAAGPFGVVLLVVAMAVRRRWV